MSAGTCSPLVDATGLPCPGREAYEWRVHPSPPSPSHLETVQQRLDALRTLLAEQLAGVAHLTLEVGSGHGHYLTAYAQAHPDEFCVGIDIILDRLTRSDRKRNRAGVKNLLFVRAEAFEFLQALPPGVRLAKILILFPDPWPKRRHHKNRLLQPRFLSLLAERALPAATLHFRTDHAEYFAWAHAHLRTHPQWEWQPDAPWPFELPTVFQERAGSYASWTAVRRGGEALPRPADVNGTSHEL